mgnify:CR=1 FL=1
MTSRFDNSRSAVFTAGVRRIGAARAIVMAGASLTALALAAPARAECDVEDDVTTCTGDNSGGIMTNTSDVVVSGITGDITAPPGTPAFWMPGAASVQIDVGDHLVKGRDVPAVAVITDRPVTVEFTGTIEVGGVNTAQGGASGINVMAADNGGWDATVRAVADITVDATRDAALSPYGNVGVFVSAGANGKASTDFSGSLNLNVSGEPAIVVGLGANGDAGATVSNHGDISVTATGGFGGAISAASAAETVVESRGNLVVDLGNGIGEGIAAGGLRNVVRSQGDITSDNGGIVTHGALQYDENGQLLPTFALAESSDVTSEGNIATTDNGAPAIVALGDTVSVQSIGDLATQGNLSAGILAMRNFTYDPNSGQPSFDEGATSVSVRSEGNIVTSGDGSVGIGVGARNGTASVETDGDISTSGHFSGGVFAVGRDASIVSSGNITTAGNADGAFGSGAGALHAFSVNGDAATDGAAIVSTGDVSTKGANAGGLLAFSISDQGGTAGAARIQSTGNVSTSGAAAIGIWAGGGTEARIVSTGDIATTGADSLGINATSQGATRVTSAGSISTAGTAAHAIFALGRDVAVHSDGNIETEGSGSHGIVVAGPFEVTGEGAIVIRRAEAAEVTSLGDISSSGTAILVAADTASVVNRGLAQTSGDLASGIHVTGTGEVTIESTDVLVTGAGGFPGLRDDGYRHAQGGIIVEGGSGAISIAAGTVAVEGEERYGISVRGSGAIDISADEVILASADSVGVVARAGEGDVSIVTGTVITTGVSGTGVYADTTSGNIAIDAGETRAEAGGQLGWFTAEAVAATSQTGAIAITSRNAFTAGEGGSAISAFTAGDVAIESGIATTTGDLGVGIFGVSYGGKVTVDADETVTSGADTLGIFAVSDGGDAIVTLGSLTATGAASDGASARAWAGRASITTAGNVLVADGHGLQAEGAQVNVSTAADSLTEAATYAIRANANNGAAIINGGTVRSTGTGGAAIRVATNLGDIAIQSHAAEILGDEAYGIFAESMSGNIVIDSGSVAMAGDQPLLFEVLPDGQVLSRDFSAIRAFAYAGDVDLRVDDIVVSGQNGRGVFALGRNVDVVVDGTIEVIETGILASAQAGEANVLVNGTVEAGTAGVSVVAGGGLVQVADGAIVTGRAGAVTLAGTSAGTGFIQFHNSGTVEASEGAAFQGAVFGQGSTDFYVRNNGTLAGGNGIAITTGGGDDVLELTELSQITGIADLGAGYDRLVLDFNDEAVAGAVGQVVSTINVERLAVDSGTWLATGPSSIYQLLEVSAGATLTIGEDADGVISVAAPIFEVDGRLNVDLSNDTEAGVLITGSGQLHLVGDARIELSDGSLFQHTGGTTVENGELLLTSVYGGDIATTGEGVFELGEGGDFTGNLVNDGTFVFVRDSDYSFLGDFSGSGLLRKDGAGTLTFAGLYAFEGTTSLLGGQIAFTGGLAEDTELDLQEGTIDLSGIEGGEQTIAGLSGEGGALQLGNTALLIQQSGDSVFSGSIAGTGELIKDGEGGLKLDGDGTGFTGTGRVDGGTLSVNGDYSNASFIVNEGGTLGGAGTIGETSVNGGTLAPGNSIDTLTVNGNVTLTGKSVFEVEVDAGGNADLLQVTGTATLGGAAVNVIAESGVYRPLTDYTILTADGGVSGEFGSVDINLAFLDPTLSYSANAVTLRLARNDIDFAAYAETANQAAVASLIEGFGYGNALYDATLTLIDDDVAPSFASLTGEVYPGYAAGVIETAEMLRRQLTSSTAAEGVHAWATALRTDVSGGRGRGTVELVGKGVAGGFGYGGNGFSISGGLGLLDHDNGKGDITDAETTFAIGQMAYRGLGGLAVNAGVQAGWLDGTVRRRTSLGNLGGAVIGGVDGEYLQLFGEVAYGLSFGAVAVEPFAGVSHVTVEFDDLSETGAPTALVVSGSDGEVTFGKVGARFSANPGLGVRPYASVAYRHAWGDRIPSAAMGFAGAPGSALVTGTPIAADAVELSAGLSVTRGNVDFEIGYDGTISNGFDSHGLGATMRLSF